MAARSLPFVFAFGIDERTVAGWQMKAGDHAERVQYQYVCRNTIQLAQVQADELWVKLQGCNSPDLCCHVRVSTPVYLGRYLAETGQESHPASAFQGT